MVKRKNMPVKILDIEYVDLAMKEKQSIDLRLL